MPETLYRANQVAEILNVTDATIRKWLKAGKLKGIKEKSTVFRTIC